MSEVKHDAEPWRVGAGDCSNWIYSSEAKEDEDGLLTRVAETTWTGTNDESAAANARRIVACVNACEGIGTQALENQSIKRLLRSSPRVLRALEALIPVFEDALDRTGPLAGFNCVELEEARKAVAAAKGETQS